MRDWVRRLLRRREPIQIELDVAEQLILQHLIRFQQAPALDLMQAVQNVRATANEQQVRLSLIRLESLRLIERAASEGLTADDRGRGYLITTDGKRLRRVLQPTPNARLQTYL